jgi:hypothetical protein
MLKSLKRKDNLAINTRAKYTSAQTAEVWLQVQPIVQTVTGQQIAC